MPTFIILAAMKGRFVSDRGNSYDNFQMMGYVESTIVTLIEFDDLPLKTDLMVKVPGLVWENAWQNRRRQAYQDQPFYVISRADLIIAKRAAGRWQDLEDIKALEATSDSEEESVS